MTTAIAPKPTSGHAPDEHQRETVKVWQAPVRIIHWLLVAAVVVLSLTGFYIGVPVLRPAHGTLWMSYAHAIHLFTAFCFIALLIGRLIFALSGNRYARWDQFLPVRRARRAQMRGVLRFYLLIDRDPPLEVGHNPLAGMTYVVLFGMFGLIAFTGLALEGLEDRGWMSSLTGWLFQLVPVGMVRLAHHLGMWLTWGFAVHHVYSAILVDRIEGSGIISSMITGWKTVPRDRP